MAPASAGTILAPNTVISAPEFLYSNLKVTNALLCLHDAVYSDV